MYMPHHILLRQQESAAFVYDHPKKYRNSLISMFSISAYYFSTNIYSICLSFVRIPIFHKISLLKYFLPIHSMSLHSTLSVSLHFYIFKQTFANMLTSNLLTDTKIINKNVLNGTMLFEKGCSCN